MIDSMVYDISGETLTIPALNVPSADLEFIDRQLTDLFEGWLFNNFCFGFCGTGEAGTVNVVDLTCNQACTVKLDDDFYYTILVLFADYSDTFDEDEDADIIDKIEQIEDKCSSNMFRADDHTFKALYNGWDYDDSFDEEV